MLECDATQYLSVSEMFETAQRVALFPGSKLYDTNVESDKIVMRPALESALQHIFRRADVDNDGFLSTIELNELQKACFTESELEDTVVDNLREVAGKVAGGIVEGKFTWIGFRYIWSLMLDKGRFETFWVLLRHYGFDDTLRLPAESLALPHADHEKQDLALTDAAISFLNQIFESELSRQVSTDKAKNALEKASSVSSPSTDANAASSSSALSSTSLTQQSIAQFCAMAPEEWRLALTTASAWASLRANLPNNAHELHDSVPHPSGSSSAPLEAVTHTLSAEGWLSMWQRLVYIEPHLVSAALPYYGFGAARYHANAQQKTPANASANTIVSPLRALPRAFSPTFVVHVVGCSGSGRTQLVRGLLNYPFEEHLSAAQRAWSFATVPISLAAAVFKHSALSSSKTSSKTSTTKPTAKTSKQPATNSTPKGKQAPKGKAPKETAEPAAPSAAPWLPKNDLAYQQRMSFDHGYFVFQKKDVERYMSNLVDDPVSDPSNDRYRVPDLVLAVYDVSDAANFKNLSDHLKSLRESYGHLAIMLVGTKSDLGIDATKDEAAQLCSEIGCTHPIVNISAKQGEYHDLVSAMHQVALQFRCKAWNAPSAVGRMSVAAFKTFGSHWPKFLLGAGVFAASWIVLSHWGLLRAHIGRIFDMLPKPVKAIDKAIESAILAIGDWWKRYVQWDAPAYITEIINRPAPNAKPLPFSSDSRIGGQR